MNFENYKYVWRLMTISCINQIVVFLKNSVDILSVSLLFFLQSLGVNPVI